MATILICSVSDPHSFYVDPVPCFFLIMDPNPVKWEEEIGHILELSTSRVDEGVHRSQEIILRNLAHLAPVKEYLS